MPQSVMRSICAGSIALIALFIATDGKASHTLLAAQTAALDSWLVTQPRLRPATSEDCGDCAADGGELRAGSGGPWTPVPDYQPYQAVGDFNHDGEIDFAVVLIDASEHDHQFVLAVFDGLLRKAAQKPSFLLRGLDLRGGGLFFGPLRPEPYHLIVGNFGSEGTELKPRGATYAFAQTGSVVVSKAKSRKLAEHAFLKETCRQIPACQIKSLEEAPTLWRFLVEGTGSYERPGYHWIVEIAKMSGTAGVISGE